jgi:hypothetical protein
MLLLIEGLSIAQAVSRPLPIAAAARVRFEVRSRWIYGGQMALEQVFSEYFGFPCQFSFHHMFHICLLFGAGTVSQLVTDEPSGLSPPTTQNKKKHYRLKLNERSRIWLFPRTQFRENLFTGETHRDCTVISCLLCHQGKKVA